MSPQLAHEIEMPTAKAGLVADLRATDVISRLAEDAAGARAGVMMIRGTDLETQAIAPTIPVTNLIALGVVMLDSSKEPAATAAAQAADNEYDVEQSLPIVRKGPIWVLCDDNAVIVAGGLCFVRNVAGGAEVLGAFRNDVDGGDAAVQEDMLFVTAHKDVDFQNGFTQRIALVELNLSSA